MPTGIYKRKYDFVTKEFLIREYVKNRKSRSQIGRELGCSKHVIRNKLVKFNILMRTLSEALKGIKKKPFTKAHRENIAKAFRGRKRKPFTEVTRRKMSQRMTEILKEFPRTGKKAGNYIDNRTKTKHYCIETNCNNKISLSNWYTGSKRCNSCSHRLAGLRCWKDPIYREKQIKASFKGLDVKPNKSEKQLNRLLQESLPKEYKFVGDGQIFINGFVPDFININGQKKLIEFFGSFWHSKKWIGRTKKQEEQRRIKHFAKYGYQTLIVWEHELNDLDKIREKVLIFNKREVSCG